MPLRCSLVSKGELCVRYTHTQFGGRSWGEIPSRWFRAGAGRPESSVCPLQSTLLGGARAADFGPILENGACCIDAPPTGSPDDPPRSGFGAPPLPPPLLLDATRANSAPGATRQQTQRLSAFAALAPEPLQAEAGPVWSPRGEIRWYISLREALEQINQSDASSVVSARRVRQLGSDMLTLLEYFDRHGRVEAVLAYMVHKAVMRRVARQSSRRTWPMTAFSAHATFCKNSPGSSMEQTRVPRSCFLGCLADDPSPLRGVPTWHAVLKAGLHLTGDLWPARPRAPCRPGFVEAGFGLIWTRFH